MTTQEAKKPDRVCYKCGTEIADVAGKYFCNGDCWNSWKAKNPIKGTWTVQEMQKRLLEMASDERNKEEKINTAKKIFNI